MDDTLKGLNAAQREAVLHDGGPLMVLAGPGTGKTRVIAHRIAHMVRERGVSPESIVALTYTVKAANQLRERLQGLIGADADGVHAHTFHGLGLRIVRRFADEADVRIGRFEDGRGGIIDSAQQTRLLRSIVLEHDLFRHARAGGLDSVVEQIGKYMGAISDAAVTPAEATAFVAEALPRLADGKNHAGETLDKEALGAEAERVRLLADAARAIELFEKACRDEGWLTFADLISMPIRILKKSGRASAILRDEWRHMVVDEFQDVNAAQIELLRLLMPAKSDGAGPDLCVVGDDDQSIYEFRGADDLAFAKFTKQWPGHATVRLADNYRSRPPIVTVANAVIGRAETRYAPDKVIVPASKEEAASLLPVECVQLEDEMQDAEVIAAMILTDRAERKGEEGAKWSDYAVVVRSHADADRVRAALEIEDVPSVAAREGTPADDEGVKDVLSWVELLANPHAAHAAARVLARPPFSFDPRVLAPLRSRYRGELTRAETGDASTPDPGAFADWLLAVLPEDATAVRFSALNTDLRRFAGEHNASETIARIITAADAAHADLLSPRERAERVKNLVALLKFARERQGRLDGSGDVRAFWSYHQDLSDDDRRMRDSALGSRVDGLEDMADDAGVDGVRLITAHSAKGLEFDTVFVPRVSPSHGYGSVKGSDGPDFPAGLVRRGDDRTAKDRAAAEARRLFYVACTRAERRLVLLARKNKKPSKSTHYFEEIVFDASLGDVVRTVDSRSALERAGALGLGRAYGWSRGGQDGLDASGLGFRGVEHRREVFERARREVRTSAASALDLAAGGDGDAAGRAAELARQAALRLGAVGAAESAGAVPAWAAGQDAGTFAQRMLDEAGRDPGGARTAQQGAPGLKPPLKLSYTRIKDYLDCPRCFYLKHVLGLKSEPGAEQVVGIAVHGALQKFYVEHRAAEAEGLATPSRERLLALGREMFFANWPRHLEADRRQLDQVLAQLGLAFDRYHAPGANVVEIESEVEFGYGPHAFTAKIDRIDRYTRADGSEAFRIVDYKTGMSSERLRTPKANDLQLGVYAFALDHLYGDGEDSPPQPGVAEYWILSTGERGVIDLAAIDRSKVRGQIDEAIAGMVAGMWEKGSKCRGECDVLGPG